ncbi:MAG TPA: hypothetical protein VLE95_08230 [Chlamydiales bacterium]|nr:hypothetical protein [Chlamydiales bacterium]
MLKVENCVNYFSALEFPKRKDLSKTQEKISAFFRNAQNGILNQYNSLVLKTGRVRPYLYGAASVGLSVALLGLLISSQNANGTAGKVMNPSRNPTMSPSSLNLKDHQCFINPNPLVLAEDFTSAPSLKVDDNKHFINTTFLEDFAPFSKFGIPEASTHGTFLVPEGSTPPPKFDILEIPAHSKPSHNIIPFNVQDVPDWMVTAVMAAMLGKTVALTGLLMTRNLPKVSMFQYLSLPMTPNFNKLLMLLCRTLHQSYYGPSQSYRDAPSQSHRDAPSQSYRGVFQPRGLSQPPVIEKPLGWDWTPEAKNNLMEKLMKKDVVEC